MKYMGSKDKIAKYILPIILENKEEYDYYVEPFCGGLGTMDKVSGIERLANDLNPFLIAMWNGLHYGKYIARDDFHIKIPMEIPKSLYDEYRNKYNHWKKTDYSFRAVIEILFKFYSELYGETEMTKEEIFMFNECFLIGWIGYMGSFNGRFYDGGYSGKTDKRDYVNEQIRNTLKQVELLDQHPGIVFTAIPYDMLDLSTFPKMIIYADPPYKNSKQYEFSKGFDYEKFYDWCRKMGKRDGCKIFISEYEMPEDFKCVWEMEVTNSMHPTKTKKPVEKLFTL